MKKFSTLLLSYLFCVSAQANTTCSYLSNIADNNYYELEALTLFKVKNDSDKRVFFHTAPSSLCKQNQLFIVASDIVTAYYTFNNENKQWIYAVYIRKDGKKATGWLPKDSFTAIGTTALDD